MRVAKLGNVQINSLLYCPGTAAVKPRDVMLHPVPRSNLYQFLSSFEVLGLGSKRLSRRKDHGVGQEQGEQGWLTGFGDLDVFRLNL